MKNMYRIIKDRHLGYEAQIKFWWFPFMYFQMWEKPGIIVNTFRCIDDARNFINEHRKKRKSTIRVIAYMQ